MSGQPTDGAGRGRDAARPSEIPPEGLEDVLIRIKDAISADNLSLASAGVAFYALLALFPGLAALVSIYGLLADPSQIGQQLDALGGVVPVEVNQIIAGQLTAVAGTSGTALGLGMVFGLLMSMWSANKGMKAMLGALNIVYGEREDRGIVRLNAVSLGMTAGATLMVVIALMVIVAVPIILAFLGLGNLADLAVRLLRWPLIAAVVIFGLSTLYRFGPDRRGARWRWLSWGSVGATVLWAAGSAGFSFYVARFGSYNETYGSMGAVIILLMWFYITAFIALVGAEVNAELEHQTRRDSTVGEARPFGERGAHVADTLGERRDEAD